jgi:hypothetical protein
VRAAVVPDLGGGVRYLVVMSWRWAFAVVGAALICAIALPAAARPSEEVEPRGKKARVVAHGAAVVAADEGARAEARALARLIYADARLRPNIDERDAQVLAGQPPPAADVGEDGQPVDEKAAARAELASVIKTLATAERVVQRRLLTGAGEELAVELVVLVSSGADGPSAAVLRVSESRFLSVTLAPKRRTPPPAPPTDPAGSPTGNEASASWDWSDAVAMMRGLLTRPPPGPRPKPAVKPSGKPVLGEDGEKADEDDDSVDLLTSPWFWGGLGVVVAVGVTVLVLSQTVFDESDTVMLEGKVSP